MPAPSYMIPLGAQGGGITTTTQGGTGQTKSVDAFGNPVRQFMRQPGSSQWSLDKSGQSQSDPYGYLRNLFGGGQGQGGLSKGIGQPSYTFDPNAFAGQLQQSIGTQRKALGDIYGSQLQTGLAGLNQQFDLQRKKEMESRAALGNLNAPATQDALSPIEAGRSQALTDLFSRLSGQQAQGQLGLEENLQRQLMGGQEFAGEQALRQAQLAQQAQLGFGELAQRGQLGLGELLQGQQRLGLSQQEMENQLAQQQIENALGARQLDIASQVGQAQAQAQKPSILGQLGGILGGLGGLAGGIGGIMGAKSGLGGLASLLGGVGQFIPVAPGVTGYMPSNRSI